MACSQHGSVFVEIVGRLSQMLWFRLSLVWSHSHSASQQFSGNEPGKGETPNRRPGLERDGRRYSSTLPSTAMIWSKVSELNTRSEVTQDKKLRACRRCYLAQGGDEATGEDRGRRERPDQRRTKERRI